MNFRRGGVELEGTDAMIHFIYYTREIEEARSLGELLNRRLLRQTAPEFLQRGIAPTKDSWGG